MKDFAIVALCKLPTLVSLIAAAWLAYKGADGWGWFLLIAVLVSVSVKVD